MRHVSRTHRVALDWLFDRINSDSKIQIKYIDTKNQFADILTKGNFTRDEWNHLLCLFNISHFSSTVCSDTMAKRSQHDSGEERLTAKSRPMSGRRRSYRPQLQSARGREALEIKIHGSQLLEKIDQGDLTKAQIHLKPPIFITMSNSWRASLQQIIQNWIMTVIGLLKSGKLKLRRTIDQGDLIPTQRTIENAEFLLITRLGPDHLIASLPSLLECRPHFRKILARTSDKNVITMHRPCDGTHLIVEAATRHSANSEVAADESFPQLISRHENPNQVSLARKLSMMEPRNPL